MTNINTISAVLICPLLFINSNTVYADERSSSSSSYMPNFSSWVTSWFASTDNEVNEDLITIKDNLRGTEAEANEEEYEDEENESTYPATMIQFTSSGARLGLDTLDNQDAEMFDFNTDISILGNQKNTISGTRLKANFIFKPYNNLIIGASVWKSQYETKVEDEKPEIIDEYALNLLLGYKLNNFDILFNSSYSLSFEKELCYVDNYDIIGDIRLLYNFYNSDKTFNTKVGIVTVTGYGAYTYPDVITTNENHKQYLKKYATRTEIGPLLSLNYAIKDTIKLYCDLSATTVIYSNNDGDVWYPITEYTLNETIENLEYHIETGIYFTNPDKTFVLGGKIAANMWNNIHYYDIGVNTSVHML